MRPKGGKKGGGGGVEVELITGLTPELEAMASEEYSGPTAASN